MRSAHHGRRESGDKAGERRINLDLLGCRRAAISPCGVAGGLDQSRAEQSFLVAALAALLVTGNSAPPTCPSLPLSARRRRTEC